MTKKNPNFGVGDPHNTTQCDKQGRVVHANGSNNDMREPLSYKITLV